jgi:hypothetical protein
VLPPVLEIYVVWHPRDAEGARAAEQFIDHFHGTAFSGLIGGAVEIYVRSEGWRSRADAPRPLPCWEPLPYGIPAAELTAIVPVLGDEFAATVEPRAGPWHDYAEGIVAAHESTPDTVGIFPLQVSRGAMDRTALGELFGRFQRIGVPSAGLPDEPVAALRSRDLAQGIAQLAAGPANPRLTVFVSHTKRAFADDADVIQALIDGIRYVISKTRLDEFFDASDLQPGSDWAEDLIEQAATGALLAVRTDLYSSREWCQREMLTAKRAGMPVVILDALVAGEERGSFLMDHVPRIPGRPDDSGMSHGVILRALDQLVDECLKRALWQRQAALAHDRPHLEVAWWSPHAPEPLTLARWLIQKMANGGVPAEGPIRVLHPDPPLGVDEIAVLEDIATLSGAAGRLEVMTPRGLAARGG